MTTALIALGANLGDRQASLDRAVQSLAALPGVRLMAASAPYATHSVGGPSGQPDFLNSAALFETSIEPASLLASMQAIEASLGRRREGPRWSPRSIDLDLLLYGSVVLESADLTVPHPRMAFRRFVIEPAAEVAASMVHPTLGWTLLELREHLRRAPPYVAIAGAPGVGKSQLAADVSSSLGLHWLKDPAAEWHDSALPSEASGSAWDSDIELLELRRALLAEAMQPGSAGEAFSISDFWFDGALGVSRISLPSERWEAFAGHWRQAVATVPRPKLLVLLDEPTKTSWNRIKDLQQRPKWLNQESFLRLQAEIFGRATAPGRGPLLRLDARQPENARIELVAAIQAMYE